MMFSTMMKMNARKSTHSGKTRMGLSVQGQYSQDGSSASFQTSSPGCPVHRSNDRSIWDTMFTEPEPVKLDTSDDVILLSATPQLNIRPLPKINFKGLSVGPKKKLVPDRNIFSALAPPRSPIPKTFESRQRTAFDDCHVSRSPQFSKASSSGESVFKRPAAPRPVTHPFVLGQRKPNISNPSTWKSNPNNLPRRAAMSARSVSSTKACIGLNINRRPRSDDIHHIDLDGINDEYDRYNDLEQSVDEPVDFGSVWKKSAGKPKTSDQRHDCFEDPLDLDQDVWTSLAMDSSLEDACLVGVEERHFSRRSPLDLEIRNLEGDFNMFHTKEGKASCEIRQLGDFVMSPSHSDHVQRRSMPATKPESNRISGEKLSMHRVISTTGQQHNKRSQTLSFGPLKNDHTEVTRNLVTHRNTTSLLSRSKPPQQRTHQTARKHGAPTSRKYPVIDLCKAGKPHVKAAKQIKCSLEIPRRHTNVTKLNVSAASHCSVHIGSGSRAPKDSSVRVKSTYRDHQEKKHSGGLALKKGSNSLQSNNLKRSYPASSRTLMKEDSISGLTCKASMSSKTRNKDLQSKAPTNINNAPGTKTKQGNSSASNPLIMTMNRLEVRLSPVKIQKTESVEYDDIDGILFASFDTQSNLESYLKTHPEKLPPSMGSSTQSNHSDSHPGHHDTKLKTLHIKAKQSSDNMHVPPLQETKTNLQNRLKRLEKQLRTDLRRSSHHEILHPRLKTRGICIRTDLLGKNVRSINLRACGSRFRVRKKASSRSKRKKPESPKVSVGFASIKEHFATPTTGLKIRFTLSGKSAKEKESPGSNMSSEATSSKTSLKSTMASLVSKTTNKLPEKESLPFKPFEQRVVSTKSAFVSDALDKYLEDEEKHPSPTVSVAGHPLLQTKACDVTFKMPSKQSSYIKTLDMALKEREMARLKSKLPTVAETAQKLAKSLQHCTDTLKMSLSKVSSEKEKTPDASNLSDLRNTTTDLLNLKEKENKPEVETKSNPLSAPKSTKIDLDEKKRCLEERLENLKKKLKESDAFLKKSTGKSKLQTSWSTKLKIVNSRLVQQLSCNSPGQNAHPIKSNDWTSAHQLEDQQTNCNESKSELGPDVDQMPFIDKKTAKVKGKMSAKCSTPKEFVRLDQQALCNKEFCRLGCVCESINLNLPVKRLTKHCRKVECIFECVCHRNSIRILRNRKRPTIFQEKSMLFYDGVGMFSNSNSSPSEKIVGMVKNPERPETVEVDRVKSCSGVCARTVGYSSKHRIPFKKTKVANSKVLDDKSWLELSNVSPPSATVCEKTDGTDRATSTVPGVLYTPLRVSLTGKSTCASIVLLAPVHPSSVSVPRLQNVSLPGNLTKLQPASDAKNQLSTGESDVPLVAMTGTPTSSVTVEGTPVTGSFTAVPSEQTNECAIPGTVSTTGKIVSCKPSASVGSSWQVNERLEPGEPNVPKDSLLGCVSKEWPSNSAELLDKAQESQNVQLNKELSSTQLTSPIKQCLEDTQILQAADHDCAPTESREKPSKDVEALSPRLTCTSNSGSSNSNLEERAQLEQGSVTVKSVSSCNNPTSTTISEKSGDGTNAGFKTSGNTLEFTSIAAAGTTLPKTFSVGNTKEKISAVVTRINSPSKLPVSQGPEDLLAKSDSVKSSPGKAVINLTNKMDCGSQSVARVIQPDSKVANISGHLKVPTSLNNMETKAKDVKKPKLTKTQVFLPGKSVSAVNSKHPEEKSRSPLLIEIQSECNWTETKNEILSSIAKYTSTSKGAPGVMRVGKYLVEILSKEENTNVTLLKKSKSQPCEKTASAIPVTSEKTEVQETKISVDKKASDTLSSSLPSLNHTTATRKPMQGPQMSPKEVPTIKSIQNKTFLPNQSGISGLNVVKTGAVATATLQGTAPLLASLPPGSIMLSNGVNPAGYLVPLKAVQEQLRKTVPRNIAPKTSDTSNVAPPSASSQNSSVPPAIMPKLITVGSANGSKKVGSEGHLNRSEIAPMPNVKLTALPLVTSSPSGKPSLSAMITKTSFGSLQLNDRICGSQVPRQTQGVTDLRLPNCNDLSSQVIGSFPTLDTDLGKNKIVVQAETSGQTSITPSLAKDPEEFVDVETIKDIGEIHPIQPPPPSRYKPRLLKPVNPTSVENLSSKPSVSKAECEVSSTVHVSQESTDEYVDVETCDETAATSLKELAQKAQASRSAGRSQSKVVSGAKRKRKSPVMQKMNTVAFGEPEFIESYFPVSPGDEETKTEQPNLQNKEKPNKAIHLIKERQRRRDQSDLFGGLKSIMLSEDSRVSKISILGMALREIKHLESESFRMEVQKTWLKQENYLKRSKLASLMGLNVFDFPSPFCDKTGPDFLEYMKERGEENDGFTSNAQSETTSQDSESVDMDSLEDDDSIEEGFVTESSEKWGAHSESVTDVDETVDVESILQTDSNYSSTINTLPVSFRHLGLPKTVPEPTAVPRVVPMSQPSATSVRPEVGVAFKGPVPVALTALPFDFNMIPVQGHSPVQNVLPDPSACPMAVWTADSSNTVQGTEQMSREPYNDTCSFPPSVSVVFPNTLTSTTDNDLGTVDLCKLDLGSAELGSAELGSAELGSAELGSADSSNLGNNNLGNTLTGNNDPTSEVSGNSVPNNSGSKDLGKTSLGVVSSSEQEEITEVGTTVEMGESEYCLEKGSITPEETTRRASSEMNVPAEMSSKEIVFSGPTVDLALSFKNISSVTPSENNVISNNRSNFESLNSENANGTTLSRPDRIVGENGAFSVSSNNSGDADIIDLSEDCGRTQHESDRLVSERGYSPSSNKKTGHSQENKSTEKCVTRAQTTSPLNISILSIKTNGGVVSVTCDNGEVIPLAVVKASTDGTMQVAVEGDISSEKVEELLSKPEVMDCLERVADTCEKLLS